MVYFFIFFQDRKLNFEDAKQIKKKNLKQETRMYDSVLTSQISICFYHIQNRLLGLNSFEIIDSEG